MKNKFNSKKIWQTENISTYWDFFKSLFSLKNIVKIVVVVIAILFVLIFGKYIIEAKNFIMDKVWVWIVKSISKSIGEEMVRDEFGNVNIMLVWYGWEDHQWWYLSDTILVVSRNPELWAITMLSVPRDLYVQSTGYVWRINGLFARGVLHSDKNLFSWADMLDEKIQEIVWLDIPYYAAVDFQWFKKVIDTLWWIEIDVPEEIYDETYPDKNMWYMTFHITWWLQVLDGERALMYARSRHSTSDFSRSFRQQLIIKATVQKILQWNNLRNISLMSDLYNQYTQMVVTNIGLKNMLWALDYVKEFDFDNIFTFNLNTNFSYKSSFYTDKGGLLYTPQRVLFGWASVVLPMGWKTAEISYYELIKKFVFIISHNQEWLMERRNISIQNGIDKTYAKNNKIVPSWWANNAAIKLKKYGFDIIDVSNNPIIHDKTTVYVSWTGEYISTLEMIKLFVPIAQVDTWNILLTWSKWIDNIDFQLVLWNDFVDYLKENEFDYNR